MLSPIIGALLNSLCTESEEYQIKPVFTDHVDVVNQLCGRNGRIKWTPRDISGFRRDKQELKLNEVRVLGAYQKSGMEKGEMMHDRSCC